MFITHVEPEGDIYVQVWSPGFEQLETLCVNMERTVTENPPPLRSPVTPENSENRLYLTKYKADNRWYRVKIIDWAPNLKYAQVYFVDYGNTEIINLQQELLYPIDELSDVASQYPYQAVRVRIDLKEIPRDFSERLRALVPLDQPVLLKIAKYDDENVPLVGFFKRSESENILFSINDSIVMDTELG